MHELVNSNSRIPHRRSRWLPSFAGSGWPERMRSTAFLFFGLTAAAGLALVAIFAQLNFPLLSPVPVGGGQVQRGGVARSVALGREEALAIAPARPSPPAPTAPGRGAAADMTAPDEHGGRAAGAVGEPTPVTAPADTGGGTGGVPSAAPPATPIPTPAPSGSAESATPPPAAAPTPAPPAEPSSKDDKKPTKAAKVDAKAEEKEEKAVSKPKGEAAKPAGPKYEPAPESVPESPAPAADDSAGKEHGNGKSLGRDK